MKIKLDKWELMMAIEEYLGNKDINFDLTSKYTEMHAQVTEDIRQHKKHKNGKVMKNEYGHPEWETVGQETKSVQIKEYDEIEIFVGC